MDKVLHWEGNYVIKRTRSGFIVVNLLVPFNEGHTHLKSYNDCRRAITDVIHERVPHGTSIYYLTSLVRLSTQPEYIRRLEETIAIRSTKGRKAKYTNSRLCRKK